MAALAREALNHDWITGSDYDAIERCRRYRNPITHFRPPGHGEQIEARAFLMDSFPYDVIERDARDVMTSVFHLLLKVVPWATNELPEEYKKQ